MKNSCDITFKNNEIKKEVTLPCPNIVTSQQSCATGTLTNGMCVSYVCPTGFSDNGTDCQKEVPLIETGIVFQLRRQWNGSSFTSFALVVNMSGAFVSMNDVFSNFTTSGTMAFIVNGTEYIGNISSNIVGANQIEFQNDPFTPLIPNNQFTYISETIYYQGYPTNVYWGGQTYTKQTTVTCTPGSTLIDGKCYEVVSKTQTQEVATTTNIVQPQTPVTQTVIVAKGEVKSDISQAHANQLAKELLNKKISDLVPLCIPIQPYGNSYISKSGVKDCTTGIPCNVTVTVLDNEFTSFESQADADNKATTELNNRYNNIAPCCIPIINYLSNPAKVVITKVCDIGYVANPPKIDLIVQEGGDMNYDGIAIPKFSSTYSVKDANTKRDKWLNDNKALLESLIICQTTLPPVANTEVLWDVTTETTTGGTISPIGTRSIINGQSFSYSVQPDYGYEIDTIKINGVDTPITNRQSFAETITVLEDKFIIPTFRQVILPAVNNSWLTLAISYKAEITLQNLRMTYNVKLADNTTLISTPCPCSFGVAGDLGFTAPYPINFSSVNSPSGIIIMNNFTEYGGSCGSTGCSSTGLGLKEIAPNQTHSFQITEGSSRFIKWEVVSSGTLPTLSSLTAPSITAFIPENTTVSITAVFE